MKFFSVIFTAALATAVLAAPVEVAERQVEAQGFATGSESLRRYQSVPIPMHGR